MIRPDSVIINNKKKSLNLFELTVPFETNDQKRHIDKTNKYAYLKTDITSHEVSVTAFEVVVRGHLSADNVGYLKSLHSFCKKGNTFKMFKENFSALAITTSYFLSRKEPTWAGDTPSLSPPFDN